MGFAFEGLGLCALVALVGCSVGLGDVTYRDAGSGGGGATTTSTPTSSTTTSSVSTGGTGGDTGTGGTGASTGSTGTGGAPPACPGGPLTDGFVAGVGPGPCWQVLDESAFGARAIEGGFGGQDDGRLAMSPAGKVENGWFDAGRGPFYFQEVAGDFLLVTRVLVSVAGNHDVPPSAMYNTAGLLVRDPTPATAGESWALIDVGKQGPEEQDALGIVAKRTAGGKTTKQLVTTSGTTRHALLGLCRRGDTFAWLYRAYGPPDGPHAEVQGLPGWSNPSPILQAGLVTSTWVADGDVVGHFAFAYFSQDASKGCLDQFMSITYPQ